MTTLKDLSEKIGGNFWEKGDLKRIYLDKGHNTKKMSTKTFVWQKETKLVVTEDFQEIIFGENTKVSHGRFGIGAVTFEDSAHIEIDFGVEYGKKRLLKRFVKLEVVENEGN